MELRLYWSIIVRRWWIVLLPPLLVLAASLALRQPSPPAYIAEARLVVDVPPLPEQPGMDFDPRYYAALTTEYLVDDLSSFVTGDVIAQAISARLAGQGIAVPPGAIQGSTTSDQIHRLVTLRVTWGDPEQAKEIIQAAAEALRTESPKYFSRLQGREPQVAVFDGPRVSPAPPGLRARLDLPLRVLLALLAGLALAFLVDYLDTTIYDAGHVERLGMPVLGEVPRAARRWPWQRRGD